MNFTKVGNKLKTFFIEALPKFFKDNFEIVSTKKSKIAGIILTAVTLLFVILDVKAFTVLEFKEKWILLAVSLMAPFIIGLTEAYTIKFKNQKYKNIFYFVFLFVMPFITITITEALNNVFIYNMTYLGFAANYLICIIFFFLIYTFSGSFTLTYIISNSIFYVFALAHSYIMDFRGTPFLPMDFMSISTAKGVANTYDYTPTMKVVTATLVFIFSIVVAIKFRKTNYQFITKIISRTFAGVFSVTMLVLFFATSFFANMGIRPDFWNQNRGYHNYGFIANFFCNTKYLYMSEPNDYNPDNIKDYVKNGSSSETPSDSVAVDDSYTKPNIICIMNESFSDLKVLGNLTTNEEYLPFYDSLTENTIKGNLYVPVIGAGTSNTEFEFLTGHTTAFLPSGSNAYMLYVKNPIASMVSTLAAQNYSSVALHPYYAVGWNRTNVYDNLGMNKFFSIENIFDNKLMQEYRENGTDANHMQQYIEENYPGQNMLLRQYISDSYDYDLLINNYENRDKSVPYFAFNVTMQNHGGYTSGCTNFDESIYATSVSKNYNKANKYLSLIKQSDIAFQKLIEYFKNVDEPTVICMFGDHQPSIETDFVSEVMGVQNLSGITVEQEQKRHITPFIIWTNYDIEEKTYDKLSSNYLSSLVLKTADVRLTEYNRYLLRLSETLPVIDTVGYIDNQNNYYKWSDVSDYSAVLNEYEKIQYNNIFDQKNVNSDVFYINGYVPIATSEKEKQDSQKEQTGEENQQ